MITDQVLRNAQALVVIITPSVGLALGDICEPVKRKRFAATAVAVANIKMNMQFGDEF